MKSALLALGALALLPPAVARTMRGPRSAAPDPQRKRKRRIAKASRRRNRR
jgi:hypothetical protein